MIVKSVRETPGDKWGDWEVTMGDDHGWLFSRGEFGTRDEAIAAAKRHHAEFMAELVA